MDGRSRVGRKVADPYERLGSGYATRRRPDPRIARLVAQALGDARTVVNVGAGAGSYEPAGRTVLSVEPSSTMVAQRPGLALLPVDVVDPALQRLRDDLESGAWHTRHADLLDLPELDLGYRLVVAPAV